MPVNQDSGEIDNDIAIAKKTEEILKADQEAGLNHSVMVRTDSKKRAKDLEKVYKENTNLKLELINSDVSQTKIKGTLKDLKEKKINGIICVDMLGEGFNFPNLKIAAIHSPHKSLEVTLQFIGRFARTNATGIGEAKFIAVPNEIEIEGEKLFNDDKVWQEMVIGLNHLKINEEVETKEVLNDFSNPEAEDIEIKDISLYSLQPRRHVKIYRLSKTLDLDSEIDFPPPFELFYRNLNSDKNSLILITGEFTRPTWSKMDKVLDIKYDLFVIYYDRESSLLFINSSRSIDGLYDYIKNYFDSDAKSLPTYQIKNVLKGLSNTNFFNIGMRNMRQVGNESYRTIAGSSTQNTIKKSDGLLYKQGHAFCTAEEGGKKINIGYSSSSKIWSSTSAQIPSLIKWCKAIAKKLDSKGGVKTNSGLDNLTEGQLVSKIPPHIISAEWDRSAYSETDPVNLTYKNKNGVNITKHISEFELAIKKQDDNLVELVISDTELEFPMKFTLEDFFKPSNNSEVPMVQQSDRSFPLFDYLEENKICFYTADSSSFIGNEIFTPKDDGITFDFSKAKQWDWSDSDIELEFGLKTEKGISIHDKVKKHLESDSAYELILYDHGSGEMADFIAIKRDTNKILVYFIHCKKSGGSFAGVRMDDLYELCGQVQKSTKWTNRRVFELKSKRRFIDKEKFIRGDKALLDSIINDLKEKENSYNIIAVQPGISINKAKDSAEASKILGATNDFLINTGSNFLLISSD